VKGVDVDFIGVAAQKPDESFSHGHYAGVCEGEAKDILGTGICFEEDLGDSAGQDLCFSGTRSGDDHYGAVNSIYGLALIVI
jgi:hypothetical protein